MKTKSNNQLLLILSLAFLFSSCFREFDQPDDFSAKIIGKWKQMKSFDLVDPNVNPSKWDWFDLNEGFTLELKKDNSFEYTRFGTCVTGMYDFDPKIHKIEFLLNCEIEFNGVMTKNFTEYLDDTFSQKFLLKLFHTSYTDKQASSILQRVE
jgi:hypothetical protein